MYFEVPFEIPGYILELFTLSDKNFYHLLGVLAVIALLRFIIPLHSLMVRELCRRNEITVLAEEYRCTEFDIFVKAHRFYYGSHRPDTIKHDFIAYLNHWPDNYILPFYIRNYLAEIERDSSDTRFAISENDSNVSPRKRLTSP